MRRSSTVPLILAVACSATAAPKSASSPSPDASVAPGRGAAPGADSASSRAAARGASTPGVASAPRSDAGSGAAAEGGGRSAAGDGPLACPVGMVLVEGEYCSEVEQECLQSWYDESNKKTVCEVFDTKTKCVGERAKRRFCIDTYAWPNQKGERPEVMNRFHQAQVKCAAVGKRLCTESEWTLACEGPEMKPFPYGYVRDPRKCNGDRPWDGPHMDKVALRDTAELARLWQGVRSGSQPRCVSDYGVADLPGNTDEVLASETFDGGWRGKFDSVHSGGPWYKGVRNQCRPKIYTHDEGFYYYFLGFRCCSEPDGQATDPRTLKQRKAAWQFERVERIAGFAMADVRKALELKSKTGDCGCEEMKSGKAQTHCRTICGTLLGPGAKDAEQLPVEGLPPFGAQKRATPEQLQRALDAGQPKAPLSTPRKR